MILYRPVGMTELRLIYEWGMRAFPPRLAEQPIFYPVLNFGYAEQIACDWNTKSGDFADYVARFEIADDYVARFERHVVGGREHEELWVPAEQLDEFNQHVVGLVGLIAAYFGPRFRGFAPDQGHLRDEMPWPNWPCSPACFMWKAWGPALWSRPATRLYFSTTCFGSGMTFPARA